MHSFRPHKHAAGIKLVAFLIVFCILNGMLCFILVPAGSFSRWVEHEAVTPVESYDLVAVGSSELLRCWDSNYADQLLNLNTFNMGSTSTTLDAGVYATFQNIMEYQKPQKVIIMVNRFSMVGEETEHPLAYIGVEPYLSSKRAKVQYFFDTLEMDGLMNRLIPWTEYHVSSLWEAAYNVKTKINSKYRNYDTSLVQTDEVTYRGKGFCPLVVKESNAFNSDNMNNTLLTKKKIEGFENRECEFLDRKITALEKMIKLCKDRQCDVIVLEAPIPITSIYSTTYYYSYTDSLKSLVEELGGQYYDLNLAKSELWEAKPEYFYDASHVNEYGAEKYTEAVCELLKKIDNGENVDKLFHTTWKEYLASIKDIAATYTLTEKVEQGIAVKAYSVTGTNVQPEYEFVLYDKDTKEKIVLQEFSKNDEYILSDKTAVKQGQVLRVYCKAVGKDDGNIRYYDNEEIRQ